MLCERRDCLNDGRLQRAARRPLITGSHHRSRNDHCHQPKGHFASQPWYATWVWSGSRGDQSWSLVAGCTFVGSSPESCHGAALTICCIDSRLRATGVVTTRADCPFGRCFVLPFLLHYLSSLTQTCKKRLQDGRNA